VYSARRGEGMDALVSTVAWCAWRGSGDSFQS